jgi:hypothetical protein
MSANSNTAVMGANTVWCLPYMLDDACVITKLWWQNGVTVAGNTDMGLYTDQGTRLIATGPIANAGAQVIQVVDIVDLAIAEGLVYFAIVTDSASTTYYMTADSYAGGYAGFSGYQMAATFPLPATLTWASAPTLTKMVKFGAVKAPRTVI